MITTSGQLILFLFMFNSKDGSGHFRDMLVNQDTEEFDDAAMVRRALDVALQHDEELVLARWGLSSKSLKVYLAKTGTIYRGAEARKIYRKCYSVDAFHLTEAPDLSLQTTTTVVHQALTASEHEVMDLLAQAWNTFVQEVRGDPKASDEDQREFMYHIHGAQNMILANAAGRVYPERYRLRGGGE